MGVRALEPRERGTPRKKAAAGETRGARSPQSAASLRLAMRAPLGSGRPLDPGVRGRVEPLLDADLSGVRVHTGPEAARATGALGASALATGEQLAFAPGQYEPGTARGERLMAHELAHVVQAQRAGVPATGVSGPEQAAEVEADRAATSVLSGQPASLVAAPAARVLRKRMADAPQAERAALSVPSTRITFTSAPLDDFFKVMSSGSYSITKPAPAGVTVELEGIDAAYRTPMTSIAMEMAGTTYPSPATGATVPLFGPGVTVMVNLALKKYGLADADYRFSWTGAAAKGTLFIETATGAPSAQNTPTATAPAEGDKPASPVAAGKDAPAGTAVSVGALGFSLVNDWPAARFDHLRRALALVPESALKVVDGLAFEVRSGKGSGGEDGHYSEDTHRVVMFSNAWDPNAARYGGSEWPVYAIAHEIGHAVDRAPLRKAWATYGGSKALASDEAALTKARSESGGRWVKKGKDFEMEVPLGGKDGAFRAAANKDGVKLPTGGATLTGGPTEYSDHDWEDVYAESFALYATDPELLKLIRPNLHAYFAKLYPRKP